MKMPRMDHVGVVVRDLAAAKSFFLALGLEVLGEADLAGAWVDRVVGLEGVTSTIVMLGAPDGQTAVELTAFSSPADEGAIQWPAANSVGIRHLAFAVDDIEAVLARLKQHGAEPFSEIQRYEDIYRLCYVRGPEGMIIELAERIN